MLLALHGHLDCIAFCLVAIAYARVSYSSSFFAVVSAASLACAIRSSCARRVLLGRAGQSVVYGDNAASHSLGFALHSGSEVLCLGVDPQGSFPLSPLPRFFFTSAFALPSQWGRNYSDELEVSLHYMNFKLQTPSYHHVF